MARKSSIHFSTPKPTSEAHNTRQVVPDYVLKFDDNVSRTKSIMEETIADRRKKIEALYREKIGQKMQNKTVPIREAVVNLDLKHVSPSVGVLSTDEAIVHLKRLYEVLEAKFGIHCFQIHVHNDEGKNKAERNWHAHLLFDWQNKKTGRMINLSPKQMVELQTVTAEVLGMERGQVNSKAERINSREYRELAKSAHTQQLKQLQEELIETEKRAKEEKAKAIMEAERIKTELTKRRQEVAAIEAQKKLLTEQLMNSNEQLSQMQQLQPSKPKMRLSEKLSTLQKAFLKMAEGFTWGVPLWEKKLSEFVRLFKSQEMKRNQGQGMSM